jgi:hypothetical protein
MCRFGNQSLELSPSLFRVKTLKLQSPIVKLRSFFFPKLIFASTNLSEFHPQRETDVS